MTQLALVAPVAPPVPEWCRLILGDASEAIEAAREMGGADLVVADPPWLYDQRAGSGSAAAADEYGCLPLDSIREHMEAALLAVRPGARCLLWTTWAMLPAVTTLWGGRDNAGTVYLAGWRWVSGGVWAKSDAPDSDGQRQGALGMGYHLRSSESEPFVILAGRGPHARADVPGCWVAPTTGRHSEKPVDWQVYAARGWCPPGGLVLDLYAGLGSVARAVARAGEGRRYIGAEIDPERHAAALSLLAQEVGRG